MDWNLVLYYVGLAVFWLLMLRFCRKMGSSCGVGHGGHRGHGSHAGNPATPSAPEAVENEAKYSCPMHPEIISKDPNATCPKCGMKLQPGPAKKALA